MAESTFTYPALLVRQGSGSPPLVLLSASAIEIDHWVGIPQKTRIVDGETLGFQRDDNPVRVDQIAQFYGNPRNVIHNPLLCAIRRDQGVDVSFIPAGDPLGPETLASAGTLTITVASRAAQPLSDLFREAREALENRVPTLKGRPDPDEVVTKLRLQADDGLLPEDNDDEQADEDGEDSTAETRDDSEAASPAEEALFEESHVTEFWSEIRAREILLHKLGSQFAGDEFLGFSRGAIESYLKPVVLVDGQHRLLGALQAARSELNASAGDSAYMTRVAQALDAGVPADAVNDTLLRESARRLPISLLLDAQPGEHVFQFVVVNQKATPVRPALLATIISTSLSEEELEPITDRLESAGVPLKSSRAISFFTKNPQSPFAGLVARGLANEGADLLSWTVLGQLVAIFRDLRGGRFFHDGKLDYADAWRRRYLASSGILGDVATPEQAFEAWRDVDGPWRDVFIEVWTAVRDLLGNQTNAGSANYWGAPRQSNLFNKPSLMTLASDFFAYLVESRQGIESADQVRTLVQEWLVDVDKHYFARDWKLANVKKDAAGTRKQWSKLWYGYRRDPRALPKLSLFSDLYKTS